MIEESKRIVSPGESPDEKTVAAWIGPKSYAAWTAIRRHIETNYPGVFSPDWIYGGKKHGWGLRYKKSKAFCTLVPEKGRLIAVIVLGGKEREETEKILGELSATVREQYESATTYHDGKWLAIDAKSDRIMKDIFRLMEIKRKPRPA